MLHARNTKLLKTRRSSAATLEQHKTKKKFFIAAAFIFIQSLNSCNQAAAERVHSKEPILISSLFNSRNVYTA